MFIIRVESITPLNARGKEDQGNGSVWIGIRPLMKWPKNWRRFAKNMARRPWPLPTAPSGPIIGTSAGFSIFSDRRTSAASTMSACAPLRRSNTPLTADLPGGTSGIPAAWFFGDMAPPNPIRSVFIPMILQAKKNGAKLIVVDPRRIAEAEKADLWLQIRPGTDVALMLGWIRIIIEEGLYDRDFVANWTVGFEDLKAAAAAYTPQRVAEITWLTPEQVIESARLYGMTRPAVITWGFGLDKQGLNATQAARARCCLKALTGNLDIPGGESLGCNDPVGKIISDEEMQLNEALPAGQRAKQLGADQYPFFGFPGWSRSEEANRRLPREYMRPPNADMTCMAHARPVLEAMITHKPYPVTAAISVASNPMLSLPNIRHTYDALKSLELYVVGEFYLTPSAALADYVFPICSTVETTELWLTGAFCVACPRGIEPLFERRNTYDFWRGLAVRLGQSEHWPWKDIDEVWDYRLSPLGLTFNRLLEQNGLFGKPEFERYKKYGFGTPSGKVELRSSTFEALGCEPLPVYREMPQSPLNDSQSARDFPLVLITGSRFMPMYHSEQRQVEGARKKRPDPLVTLHPETAAGLNLIEGDWVRVETPQGSIRLRLHLSDKVDPRMADAEHGWWFPEREEAAPTLFSVFESNANVLCPDGSEFCSPEIGSWPHTALLCRIRKMIELALQNPRNIRVRLLTALTLSRRILWPRLK